jgi:hypothetical protein
VHKKDSEFFQVRSAELSGEKKVDIDSIFGAEKGVCRMLQSKIQNKKMKKSFPFN